MSSKKSKIQLGISKEPALNTFRHAIWAIKHQLPAMKSKLIELGKKPEENAQYVNREKRAWQEYFDHYFTKAAMPAYDPIEARLWYEMEETWKNGQKMYHKTHYQISQMETAWDKYKELKEKQLKERGTTHHALRPPGFVYDPIKPIMGISTETQTDTDKQHDMGEQITKFAGNSTSETQTTLSYCVKQTGSDTFTLPAEQNLPKLEPPFDCHRPENYLKHHLETVGMDNYLSEVTAKMDKPTCFKLAKLRCEAQTTWQKALNSVAIAQQYVDLHIRLGAAQAEDAMCLLDELHRRVCYKMTVKKGPLIGRAGALLPSTSTEPDRIVNSAKLSIEQLMELQETTVQREPTEGCVKACVDMTRSQFSQLEKVLLSTKAGPNHMTRLPKKKKDSNFVVYTLYDELLVNLFFGDARVSKFLQITKKEKTYKALISSQNPVRIGYGQRTKYKSFKLWIELKYRII